MNKEGFDFGGFIAVAIILVLYGLALAMMLVVSFRYGMTMGRDFCDEIRVERQAEKELLKKSEEVVDAP